MKICIIAEGSYPYVTGGVSSWIQTLISSMPEHEFIIYAIGATEESRGKFKYNLPANLIEVREVFLDSFAADAGKTGKYYKLDTEQREAIESLLAEGTTDWNKLFYLFTGRRPKIDTVSSFLKSKDFFDIIQEVGGHYPEIPFTRLFWTIRSMFLPLFWLLKNPVPEADVYHSVSTGYAGIVGAYGKHLYNKPFVLTEHGIYTREREEEVIKADWISGAFKDLWIQYFYSLSQGAYLQADQVISLFTKIKEIQTEIGCKDDKISVIPNGVSTGDFNFLPKKPKEEEPYVNIGAIIRVVPIKDIKTMLQSYALVQKEVPNARFYVFGPYEEDTEYYEECLQLIDSLELENVYFTGTVDVKQYIGKMDILVLSSISEGQPLAILEGMACSKPFVCTDVGSCRELLYGLNDGIGSAGYIVPVMQYADMAKAIISLSLDPERRTLMGKNGKKRVETFYTREGFIGQYKKIYESTRVNQWQELVSK